MIEGKYSTLPTSWTRSSLRELLSDLESGSRPRGGVKHIESGIPSIGGEHLDYNGGFNFSNVKYVPEDFAAKMTRGHTQKGDILVVKDGATTGKTSLVRDSFPYKKAVINEHVFLCRCKDGAEPKYVFYFLFSSDGNRQILKDFRGAAQGGISQRFADLVMVPLAPLPQQKLIVSEIEKQFSRLDEAVAALKRIKANLKHYKASVLKAAVEGRLTEEWRKKNKDVEPADKLLKRILAERKKKWEAEHPGKKYKEPIAADISNLPELPDGWVWVTWETILAPDKNAFKRGPFGSSLKKSIFVASGYKVYEQYCPINDDCSFARYFITKEKFKELEAFAVQARDFLVSCSGVTLGRITQVPDEHDEGVINQALLRVRINNVVKDAFFIRLFRSPYFQQKIFDNSTGSAIPNVKGVDDLKAIPLPLPPLEEQNAIIQTLDERISVVSEIEKQVEYNLKRAERLRQAILKKAFSGRL